MPYGSKTVLKALSIVMKHSVKYALILLPGADPGIFDTGHKHFSEEKWWCMGSHHTVRRPVSAKIRRRLNARRS